MARKEFEVSVRDAARMRLAGLSVKAALDEFGPLAVELGFLPGKDSSGDLFFKNVYEVLATLNGIILDSMIAAAKREVAEQSSGHRYGNRRN